MLLIRWFLSHTVRQAVELRKHVLKLVRAQKDIMAPQAVAAITEASDQLLKVLHSGAKSEAIQKETTQFESVANKWIPPYPAAAWRENVEVLLVAVAVAMAIRTFFLQPMKIPTGSMQPTLYGLTYQNLKGDPTVEIPGFFQRRIDAWFRGISYYHIVAKNEGTFRILDNQPRSVFPLINRQRFQLGGDRYSVWFPGEKFFLEAGIMNGQTFSKGEDIVKMKVTSGDHLFVNRLTYNFRKPERGEIIIFETRGIDRLPQDTFYIKRLVGLGGDCIRITDDQHLVINGERLTAATRHFENVYTFNPEFKENCYFGHANQVTGQRYGRNIAEKFPNESAEVTVRKNHYMAMGDNTMNSSDSRTWGDFPRENVIGKSGFVYWPISSRFGWSY